MELLLKLIEYSSNNNLLKVSLEIIHLMCHGI